MQQQKKNTCKTTYQTCNMYNIQLDSNEDKPLSFTKEEPKQFRKIFKKDSDLKQVLLLGNLICSLKSVDVQYDYPRLQSRAGVYVHLD